MNAVRFAMFAERAVQIVEQAKAVRAQPTAGLSVEQLRWLIPEKAAADRDIAQFEPILYPEDE